MHFPGLRKAVKQARAEHNRAMTDLQDKDRVIDDLLLRAEELVDELRASLVQAAAEVRSATGRGSDGDGG